MIDILAIIIGLAVFYGFVWCLSRLLNRDK